VAITTLSAVLADPRCGASDRDGGETAPSSAIRAKLQSVNARSLLPIRPDRLIMLQ
jgi:hypothetical protein